MPETYPSNLPSPLIQNSSHSEVSSSRRNDVSVGKPIYRLLSEDAPCLFDVVFSFSQLELSQFELWWKNTIVYGSKSFNINLRVGSGNKTHTCHFDSEPEFSTNRKRWRVSATLIADEKIYGDS